MALLYVCMAILMPYKRINLTFSFFLYHCVPFSLFTGKPILCGWEKAMKGFRGWRNVHTWKSPQLFAFKFDFFFMDFFTELLAEHSVWLLYEKYLVHIFILSTVLWESEYFPQKFMHFVHSKMYQQVGAEWVVQSVKCPQEKKLSSTLLILLLFCGMK
jgi:hypothetical protein